VANEQNFDPGQQMRLNSACPPSSLLGVAIPQSRQDHHRAIDNTAVRQLYAGLGGAALKTLSFLSLHVALSERWFRGRMFDLRGAKRILDAGCGAGQLTQHLARYADPDASITACDFSVEMLLRARQRLQGSSIQFVLGDLKQLPFADASFDCITCGYAIEHLSDARSGLAELARVLRVGGRLLLRTTEDNWTGHLTSRVWSCRAYNRQELQYRCHEKGLIWKKELWYSSVHQRLGIGGICVEIERQRVDSEEFRRDEDRIPVRGELSATPVVSQIINSQVAAETLRTDGEPRSIVAR
jgi:ubiquinone/menaquinone biosynthesis C-methylase UbiE